MTIPELLVHDGVWRYIPRSWRRPIPITERTFTASTMTIDDLCAVCHHLGVKPTVGWEKRGTP